MTSVPRISVVIPCHNRGQFLDEAVQSVLVQEGRFELVEVIVVDDHSDDAKTHEALERLAEHPLVRVLHNEGPRGPSAPRNVGIRAARGEWIAFLDSDDVWLEGSLAARAEVAVSQPECQWIGADIANLYEDGRRDRAGRLWSGKVTGPILREGEQINEYIQLCRPVGGFVHACLTSTITTMLRKTLLKKTGGFDESLRRANDYHLWVRLALETDLWFIPRVLALYRQHGGNITRSPGLPKDSTIQACEKLLVHPGIAPYRSLLRDRLGHLYRVRGARLREQRAFFHAARAYAASLAFVASDWPSWKGLAASILRRP